ncbi:MAG: helix-turn-helix domain-containing protein [Pseudomonadota bacterium]
MSKKSPNPVDIHVGSRVRMRRVLIGMSQEKLGAELGLTFQQVQKYEKGANRIGASRLYQISSILGVPVSFFFEGVEATTGDSPAGLAEERTGYSADMLTSPEGLALNRAFFKISDQNVRRRIVDLVKSLSEA